MRGSCDKGDNNNNKKCWPECPPNADVTWRALTDVSVVAQASRRQVIVKSSGGENYFSLNPTRNFNNKNGPLWNSGEELFRNNFKTFFFLFIMFACFCLPFTLFFFSLIPKGESRGYSAALLDPCQRANLSYYVWWAFPPNRIEWNRIE